MTLTSRIVAATCALVLGALLASAGPAHAALGIQNQHVEYRHTPLGIDVQRPRFGWQMLATAGELGVTQAAYRLEVRDPKGTVVWDSGRVSAAESLAVTYAGRPLAPQTRYAWTVTVWTSAGATLSASSWFETGLMDPSPSSPAWAGAQWIGGRDDDLVLYAPYLVVFDASFVVAIAPGSTRASFIYGANDSRLMSRDKNIFQVDNARDQSYIKLELDISALDAAADGSARLHVYRAGYTSADTASTPLRSFNIDTTLINRANRHTSHTIGFRSTFGQIALTVNGSDRLSAAAAPDASGGPAAAAQGQFGRRPAPNVVNLNPAGVGGDYLPFGMLCDIGFSVDAGQRAAFSDVTVRHTRVPGTILFRERLADSPYAGIFADVVTPGSGLAVAGGKYEVSGGAMGLFVARDPSRNALPMLRTTFKAQAGKISAARLYVTARGIYEIHLNGVRVGDDHYNPGLTQYNVTHLYQTYDVTGLVRPGDNAIGAMLGEGWWSGLLSFGSIWNHFGDRHSLLATLVITYDDGHTETVTTNDRTWKYWNGGPIVYSSLMLGEVYDATREAAVAGWSTAAFDDAAWTRAVEVPLEGTTFSGTEGGRPGAPGVAFGFGRLALVGQVGETAGVFRTLPAKRVRQVRPGVFVYDMGQNLVGVPRIRIDRGQPGRTVTLRFAEMLYPDLPESGSLAGMIMTENYRAALSQDVYTMREGPQVFQPRFTSHGYQYVEITGLDEALPLDAVSGVVISSVRELTADYRTSDPRVNQLWSNLVWSNVGNFLSIPTDCPQRNERMGWSGDISVFSRTATYVSNANPFLTRHLMAMRDVQLPSGKFTDIAPVGGGFGGVLWGSAGIIVPWEAYLQYGDVALLEHHYPAMAAYADYLETTLDPKTGLSSDGMLGDWLGPQNNALGSAFLVTAYHAYALDLMSRTADLLGKPEDAARYRRLYDARKTFFNATFVNADRKTLATGRSGFGGPPPAPGAEPQFRVADTQTSYAVGLGLGVFEDASVPAAVRHLADAVSRESRDDDGVVRPAYSLMTGFIGTAWISEALSGHGHSELAYRQLLNAQYPSWLYSVEQGATTIWERLNGYTVERGFGGNNSMNSFNHYSFGAVGYWMLAHSLGIQRGTPGFQQFTLRPEPDPTGALTSAEGHYDSMYGRIASAWRVGPRTLTYQATVPANTEATLWLPSSSADAVREGGKDARLAAGVTFVKYEQGRAVYRLASGTYEFTAPR